MSEQTNNSEYNTVTLSLDDGTECECAIIRIFPAGENDYIAPVSYTHLVITVPGTKLTASFSSS